MKKVKILSIIILLVFSSVLFADIITQRSIKAGFNLTNLTGD